MQRLARPRHLAITAMVFLLMGGAGTGLVGASAAQEAREATIVAAFAVPLPAQGDRGNYSILHEGSLVDAAQSANVSMRQDWLRFEWFEDRMLPTSDGELTLSNRLRYHTGPDRVNGVRGPIMEAGTNVPFAHEWLAAQSDPEREEVDMLYKYTLINHVPCMLRHGLQGMVFDVTAQLVGTDMACKVPSATWPMPTQWRPLGVMAGSDPAIVVMQSDFRRGTFEAQTRMWLQDGLPYPVRHEETWRTTHNDRWGRVVHTLQELDRGVEAIATQTQRAALPPLQEAHGMPDDAALRMVFPLGEALEAGREHDPIAQFLAAHPDAYVGSATHRMHEDPEGRRHDAWTVIWTNGSQRINGTMTKTTGPIVIEQPLGPVTTIVVPTDADPVIHVKEVHLRLSDPFPLPDARVTSLPTLESMVAQWEAVSGPKSSDPANTWGFSLACATTCSTAQAWVGSSVYRLQDDNPLGRGETTATRLRHIMTWNGTQVVAYSETRDVAGTEAPRPVRTASTASLQAVPDAPWMPLTARQMASVTAVAFLAALAYWLAPLAKHGIAAPLFTRIRDDRVLDHPVRRAAYEAIAANPGIHAKQLQAMLGQAAGTVGHHARRLEAAGRIRRVTQGRYTCFFATGTVDHRLQSAAGALRAQAACNLLSNIAAAPGITGPRLLARLDVGQSTMQYHLKRLRQEELVEQRREGRAMGWYPTGRGLQAVEQGMA